MMHPAQVADLELFDGGLAAIAAMAVLTSLASCLDIPSNASGQVHFVTAPTAWPDGVMTDTFSNHWLTDALGGARLLSASAMRK